jgi:serine protease Do
VVSIAVQKTTAIRSSGHPLENHPMFKDFFRPNGRQQPRRSAGAGSGVVISKDGYVVTNNHVVDGADKVIVSFSDGKSYTATLVGTDKSSDIALIKIEGKEFPYLEFGDSKNVRLGQFVLAIGNPFGVGQTVTMGIISAKGRANIGIADYEDFIQTDAAINPGNSGGALVDLKGQLIGINTAILSRSGGNQGIGLAVPASMVRPVLEQIRTHGRVRRGWLGVAIQNLSPDLAKELNIEAISGVLISDVLDTGPAGKSGIQAGDVITSVGSQACATSTELRNHIALLGPNTTVKIKLIRDGKSKTIRVKLEEKEDLQTVQETIQTDGSLFSGVQLKTLEPAIRNRLEAPKKLKGVVVTDLAPDSAAADAGLRPGDVITSVNRKKVESVRQLVEMGQKAKKLLLRVWRKGHSSFMVLKR